jgi:hypothetical protein
MNNSHFNLFNFLKWRTLRTKNETKKRQFEGKKIANNQVKNLSPSELEHVLYFLFKVPLKNKYYIYLS